MVLSDDFLVDFYVDFLSTGARWSDQLKPPAPVDFLRVDHLKQEDKQTIVSMRLGEINQEF